MFLKKSLGHDWRVCGLAFVGLVCAVLLTVLAACKDEPGQKSENNIISFKIGDVVGAIRNEKSEISVIVPAGANLARLAPEVKVSSGASVFPESGDEVNFTYPTTYVVTAESGNTRPYTVTVTVPEPPKPEPPKSENNIISFKIGNAVGAIRNEKSEISVVVPAGTNLAKLNPVVQVSSGAGVLPKSGDEVNCTHPTTYVVTAENGNTKAYVVTVTVPAPVVLESIAVSGYYPTTYQKGTDFDFSKITVTGTYSDNSTSTETITAANIIGYNKDIVGTQIVSITVNGRTCELLGITVNDTSPAELSIKVGSDRKLTFWGVPAGGLILSRSGSNGHPQSAVISIGSTLDNSTTWNDVECYLDKIEDQYRIIPYQGNTTLFTVDARYGGSGNGYTVGKHRIFFSGHQDGIYYSEQISFEVTW